MLNPDFLSSEKVYRWTERWLPWLLAVTALGLLVGLVWGLLIAPADYKQGEAYRIIYIHVPAAWMSMFLYMLMAACGLVALVWRIKLAEIISMECAPVGATMTALALLTGMLWGKPMWGAYWVWDARLTSELILLFLYGGVMAINTAIPDPRKAARAAAVLAIIGVINIPIIHYSVVWWNTLHQGPTVTRFDTPAAHISILLPLLLMAVVFKLACLTAIVARTRNTIMLRAGRTRWLQRYV